MLFSILGISCSQTRHIEEGYYLLNKSKIEVDSKEIDHAEIKRYEKQIPNKRILGVFKFHLFLYNLASPKSYKFPSSWFRKIGQEPVIWNSTLTQQSSKQFEILLENKGYYHAKVTDTVELHKKRANITYNITLNNPYRFSSINYIFEDQGLASVVLADSLSRLIQIGSRFDKDVLQKERLRLEELLKNNGYYYFSKEYIFYEARKMNNYDSIELTVIFKENITGEIDPSTKIRKHYQYLINKTYLYPNFNLINPNLVSGINKLDSVTYNNHLMVYAGKHNIKPNAVIAPNMCLPGSLYRIDDVKKTYNHYISMGLFRVVNIYFKEPVTMNIDSSKNKYIDCHIELSPRKTSTYQIELLGTNTSYDLGASAGIIYNNYNFFRGAEHFRIKFTGSFEGLRNRTKNKYSDMMEFSIEPSLTLPVFIVPFNAQKFVKKFNPKTLINLSYNYQNHPYYKRNIGRISFGYQWKGNSYNQHRLYPIDFSYVYLPKGITDSTFKSQIEGTPLLNSYVNHTILAARYQFEFSNQDIEKLRDFSYIIYNIESAGFLISNLQKLINPKNDSTVFGVNYFQYLKSDIDIRHNNQFNSFNSIAYRFFVGIGYAYGNSDVLPFEIMYYEGGPNGIRAWDIYSLGPGSVSDTVPYVYGTRLGDIKIESNIEYRFKLFWKMEGSLFLDAGNIWTRRSYPNRPGGSFMWKTFYDDIAVGSGFGLRFDFSYLLFRTDFGFKLRDPAIMSGSKWIDFNSQYRSDHKFMKRWTFQFAIGYPF